MQERFLQISCARECIGRAPASRTIINGADESVGRLQSTVAVGPEAIRRTGGLNFQTPDLQSPCSQTSGLLEAMLAHRGHESASSSWCPRSGHPAAGGSYAGQQAKESCLPSRDLYLGAASQLHVQSPIHSKVYAFDVFEIDDLLAVSTKEPFGIQTRFEA